MISREQETAKIDPIYAARERLLLPVHELRCGVVLKGATWQHCHRPQTQETAIVSPREVGDVFSHTKIKSVSLGF